MSNTEGARVVSSLLGSVREAPQTLGTSVSYLYSEEQNSICLIGLE